jgi:2-polyprenyl-3-methyl-5-hydroxy-6-metoxy-1,4-benzoquinol methylase
MALKKVRAHEDVAGRFALLRYADFQRMARDPSLNKYEKIGFPAKYRLGYESEIFRDIRVKLPNLGKKGQTVLDIGPGCSDLPRKLINLCRRRRHRLVLVDSAEMLAHLPNATFVKKICGRYPNNVTAVRRVTGAYDVILCYSVIHHVFADGNVWEFLDQSIDLLKPGGEMLIGDIPNISKRRRFFSTTAGVAYHRAFTKSADTPQVDFNVVVPRQIDDAVIAGLVLRARSAGVDAYLLPQPPSLAMANRREDILLRRP